MLNEHEKAIRARKEVEAMTGFYIHFAIFTAVMLLLFIINLLSDGGWWVQWPLLGWGAGCAAHAWAVFGSTPRFITDWQLRKIKALKEGM